MVVRGVETCAKSQDIFIAVPVECDAGADQPLSALLNLPLRPSHLDLLVMTTNMRPPNSERTCFSVTRET